MYRLLNWMDHQALFNCLEVIIIATLIVSVSQNEASNTQGLRNSAENDLSIVKKQAKLIEDYSDELIKVQDKLDTFLSSFYRYCQLKDKDDSFWPWNKLSVTEKNFMTVLKRKIGPNQMPCYDADLIRDLVLEISEKAMADMLAQLEELESAMLKMDIPKMKQLQQKIMINNEKSLDHDYNIDKVKSEISTELERTGFAKRILKALFSFAKSLLPKIVMEVARKVLEQIIGNFN